jgi:hypothetical protein
MESKAHALVIFVLLFPKMIFAKLDFACSKRDTAITADTQTIEAKFNQSDGN